MSPETRTLLALLALSIGIALAVMLAIWLASNPLPRRLPSLREANDVIAEAIHIAREAAHE